MTDTQGHHHQFQPSIGPNPARRVTLFLSGAAGSAAVMVPYTAFMYWRGTTDAQRILRGQLRSLAIVTGLSGMAGLLKATSGSISDPELRGRIEQLDLRKTAEGNAIAIAEVLAIRATIRGRTTLSRPRALLVCALAATPSTIRVIRQHRAKAKTQAVIDALEAVEPPAADAATVDDLIQAILYDSTHHTTTANDVLERALRTAGPEDRQAMIAAVTELQEANRGGIEGVASFIAQPATPGRPPRPAVPNMTRTLRDR